MQPNQYQSPIGQTPYQQPNPNFVPSQNPQNLQNPQNFQNPQTFQNPQPSSFYSPQAPVQPQPQPQSQFQAQPTSSQTPPTPTITVAPQPAKAPAPAPTPATPPAARSEDLSTTQSTLLISELRDSMVIMKDGSFRAVVACKSINFDLMSEQEREGIEFSYQNFLNSLNFTTQILIRSQRIDIGPYIDRLIELRRNNDNMLLGKLMDDYIDFIDELSQEANIMDKSFFVVVPYYTSKEAEKAMEESKNFFKTFSRNKAPTVSRINRDTYDKAVTEINNQVEAVISGLFQLGIHSVRLNTKELAQLYYNFNNPDTAVREPLGDFNKVAHLYVKKAANNGEVK